MKKVSLVGDVKNNLKELPYTLSLVPEIARIKSKEKRWNMHYLNQTSSH